MSFQWIIDSAETLSINRLDVVAQTQTRDGQIKAVPRGTAPTIITVKFPDGKKWSDLKSDIESAEALGRAYTDTIYIRYSDYPWFYNYDNTNIDEDYTVICREFPQWTIFAQDRVSWSGPFVFVQT